MSSPTTNNVLAVFLYYSIWVLLLAPVVVSAGEVQQERSPRTGLYSWHAEEHGFSIQLVQILPDMVKAVYSSRGLPPRLINSMKDYCVFGTIIRNTSDKPVNYRVADWQYVTPDGQKHPIKTKTQWIKEWEAMGVPYRWSILADDQTFQPGDWIQGFTTVKLPPESKLDLIYTWRLQDESHQNTIKGLRCAPAEAPKL